MTANQLITTEIPALHPFQTGQDAFRALSEYHVKHLPIVKDGRLCGSLSEEDIFNNRLYEPIQDYVFAAGRNFAVQEHDHLFEVFRMMGEHKLTTLPVINKTGEYLGLISQNSLIRAFANTSAIAEPGAILVLVMNKHDYSLSEIARIIESEDTKLMNVTVSSKRGDEDLEITLKLNRQDMARVVAALERYSYIIRDTFVEPEYETDMKERYEAFLKYLEP